MSGSLPAPASPAPGQESAYGFMPAPPEAPADSPRHPGLAAALGVESGLGGRPVSLPKKPSDPDQYGGFSAAVGPADLPPQYGGLPAVDPDSENDLPIAEEEDDSGSVVTDANRQAAAAVASKSGYGSFAGALAATGTQSAPAALGGSAAAAGGEPSKQDQLKQLLSTQDISQASLKKAGLLRQFAGELGRFPASYYDDTVLTKARGGNKVSIKSYDKAAVALQSFLGKNDNKLPSELDRKDRK